MRTPISIFFAALLIFPSLSVQASTSSGMKQKLEALALKKVKTRCHSCKVKVHSKWISPNVLKKSPHNVKDLVFTKSGLPSGFTTAKVIFKNDSSPDNKIQLYISVRRELPVARKLIKRGKTIHKNDLVKQWTDISKLPQSPVSSVKECRGKTATRVIRKGQIFFFSDLAGSAVIQAGDHVKMLYKKGGLHINFDCIARETKKTGQKIRLYSKKTDQLYIAKIISKGKIIWEKTL
jgi:flagella basal body P-ring formation protein FlgA